MGLKLSGVTYNWTSDMELLSKGAAYTSHMFKNQTSKMEWCIENLKTQYGDVPEELAILSRSIATLKSYIEEMKKHSENIVLLEESCNLRGLLDSALDNRMDARIAVSDSVCWACDKNHMTEVFINIISNAVEATVDTEPIEITGGFDKNGRMYQLSFADRGSGMSEDELQNMFTPYFTTKNTERNFGLGLAYSKNVVEKHGGVITAVSEQGKGTTVIICLPAKRVIISGGGADYYRKE